MNFTDLVVDLAIETNATVRNVASKLNLTTSQAYHLLLIPFDGISMSVLAKKLGLDASTLTRNIHNLEKHGLIARQNNNKDKRMQLIFLTKNGVKVVRSMENDLEEQNFNILELIDLDTQESLYTSLEKLSWALACKKN